MEKEENDWKQEIEDIPVT